MRQLAPLSIVSWRGRNKEAPPACKQNNPEGEVEGRMARKKQPSRLVSQDEDCEGPVRIRALVSEPMKFHICAFSANIRERRSPSM